MARRLVSSMIALVVLATMTGCRESAEECSASSHADISGTWTVTRTLTSDSCDPDAVGQEDLDLATVTQDGEHIEVMMSAGDLEGEVCGDDFSASGSTMDTIFDCTVTQSVSINGTLDGDTITGRSSWSYRTNQDPSCFGVESCSGTYSFTAERM